MRFASWLLIPTCLAAALIAVPAAPAAADERAARVSDVQGTLSVRGEDEDDVSAVYRNTVVREGDTLWTDTDSYAELELERGNWLRLAGSTKLDLCDLNGTPEFRLWSGAVYLDVSNREQRPLRLDTPEGDVEVYPDSVVRVDLAEDSRARISVWSGEVRLTPDRGEPARARSSERAYLEDGRLAGTPERFDRDDRDSFDRYQRERLDYYLDRPAPPELQQELVGARELYGYGSWVETEGMRCWRPYVEAEWRPYSRGYWALVPVWGYAWVDYHPWGYVTCHYGRWLYRPTFGWLWYPGYRWGPSWVYWSTYGDYIGWSPLDPWDHPCYYGYGNFVSVNLVIDFRSWTFCHRDRFHHGRHHWLLAGGRRDFYNGHEVRVDPGRFRLHEHPNEEIGIPREHVRGLTVTKDGRPVRDRVLDLERRLPEKRRTAIRNRFHLPPDRDRERLMRPSDADRLQRNPWLRVDPDRMLRGSEAERRFPRVPAPSRPGRSPATPAPGPERRPERRPERDDPFRRTGPLPVPSARPPVRTTPRPDTTPRPRYTPSPRYTPAPDSTPNPRTMPTPRTSPTPRSTPAPRPSPRYTPMPRSTVPNRTAPSRPVPGYGQPVTPGVRRDRETPRPMPGAPGRTRGRE